MNGCFVAGYSKNKCIIKLDVVYYPSIILMLVYPATSPSLIRIIWLVRHKSAISNCTNSVLILAFYIMCRFFCISNRTSSVLILVFYIMCRFPRISNCTSSVLIFAILFSSKWLCKSQFLQYCNSVSNCPIKLIFLFGQLQFVISRFSFS